MRLQTHELFFIGVRYIPRAGKKLNLDSNSDQIIPFSKGGKSLSRVSGGTLESKSVLNLLSCRIADTHSIFYVCMQMTPVTRLKQHKIW